MDEFGVKISGIGSYTPEKRLTNADLEKMVDTSDEWITTRSGIKERRIAAPEQATSDLAYNAAKDAIDNAGVSPKELDLIILASATHDMLFPATACLVQEKLGAVNAGAFDLQIGCSGFMYAMATGAQFIINGTFKKVLVIGADTLSRFTNWKDRNTCVLFGDGAGAVVLEPTEKGKGLISFILGSKGAGAQFLKLQAGGSRLPASAETVEKELHYIQMAGNEVFKFAATIMDEASRKVLEKANIPINEVSLVIPHQANIRIINMAAERLKLPIEKFYINVDKYGNTSCASIPLALHEAIKDGRVKEGDILLMVGFGAGLSWASCLFRW